MFQVEDWDGNKEIFQQVAEGLFREFPSYSKKHRSSKKEKLKSGKTRETSSKLGKRKRRKLQSQVDHEDKGKEDDENTLLFEHETRGHLVEEDLLTATKVTKPKSRKIVKLNAADSVQAEHLTKFKQKASAGSSTILIKKRKKVEQVYIASSETSGLNLKQESKFSKNVGEAQSSRRVEELPPAMKGQRKSRLPSQAGERKRKKIKEHDDVNQQEIVKQLTAMSRKHARDGETTEKLANENPAKRALKCTETKRDSSMQETSTLDKSDNSTSLLGARKKLDGAQFRWINEQLYTMDSSRAQELFVSNVQLYEAYHKGYKVQVERWPVNPLQLIIADIKRQSKELIVADFGCGSAELALNIPNKAHSFDLVASNESIVACDMAHVPLKSCSVDISVFCLSLMGTNITDFLLEAHRVLKGSGVLKIAEVVSRFSNQDSFVRGVESLGFTLRQKDDSNVFFVLMDFIKSSSLSPVPTKQMKDNLKLKPCLYKRR
ncbi:uncharacterized protein LOC134190114 [Corticium candelabrum]|uniref:uncharacterized protein LOC134190114 n=1 Tax=Corticium candelabrum TaxID=121492 RepID=UPI002E260035|nr:uncharacterized protein LOC134190114 [Corticium candelabrum]